MSPTALPSARLPSSSARTRRPRRGPDMARTRARTPRAPVVRDTDSKPREKAASALSETDTSSEVLPPCTGRSPSRRTAGTSGKPSAGAGATASTNRTTRSATPSKAGRCTTSSTVRPTASLRTASTTSASVAPSRAAVGSSSSSTGRSARNARASASRCRCPADSPAPSSPSTVSTPSGSASTNSRAPASASARLTAASSASGRVSRAFSAIVPAYRCGLCGTQAMRERHSSKSSSARSAPPTDTRPSVGRTNPSSTFSSVDLPAPLGPTSATVSPGSTWKDASDTASVDRPG